METTEIKLKPCPFCGGKPFVSARLPYFGETLTVAVVCEDCNAASKHKEKEEEAIEAWNRRAKKHRVTFADIIHHQVWTESHARCVSQRGGLKMAMRLEKENVRIIFMDLLNDMEFYGLEGKDAEYQSCYISGALDMANAVIEAIGQLGGK